MKFHMSPSRGRKCIIPMMLAVSVLLAGGGQALAQHRAEQYRPVWPVMSASVTNMNGWVVAQGITLEMSRNRVVWQTPLAPVGQPVSVRNGTGAMFVQIGNRAFVVDYGTGVTNEVRDGQVIRQFGPNQPALSGPVPAGPGAAPAGQQTQRAAVQETTAPPAYDDGGSRTPEVQRARNYQVALRELMVANDQWMQAVQDVASIRKTVEMGLAPQSELSRAQSAVKSRQEQVRRAQRLAERYSPTAAIVARPPVEVDNTPPQQREQIERAKERVLWLHAMIFFKARQVNRYQAAEMSEDDPSMVLAREELQRYNEMLDQTQANIEQLRVLAAPPLSDKINPELREQLELAQQRVLDSSLEVRRTRTKLDREKTLAAMDGNEDRAALTTANLLSTIQRNSYAKKELVRLREVANAAAAPPEATAPEAPVAPPTVTPAPAPMPGPVPAPLPPRTVPPEATPPPATQPATVPAPEY